jgi:hypothetical protein
MTAFLPSKFLAGSIGWVKRRPIHGELLGNRYEQVFVLFFLSQRRLCEAWEPLLIRYLRRLEVQL